MANNPFRLLMALCFVEVCSPGENSSVDSKQKDPPYFAQVVREDIFAGFSGNDEALKRGIAKCDEALKQNPKHAEAMVWKGAAGVYLAGKSILANQTTEGMALLNKSLKEMDEAVKLEPRNLGVRLPRGAILLSAGRNAPSILGKPLIEKALVDFQTIYEQQKDHLNSLGTHPQGELRMGLADMYRALGQFDQSNTQLHGIVKDMPNTQYATEAKVWLAAKKEARLEHTCFGCHRQ